MINPSAVEKELILICKGHFREEYPLRGNWYLNLKPFYEKHWGWSPEEFNEDYLRGMFNFLLNTFLKVAPPRSDNWHLSQLLEAVMYRSFLNDEELPVQRGINKLVSLIRDLQVVDNGVVLINLG